jgi:hypothetical protein
VDAFAINTAPTLSPLSRGQAGNFGDRRLRPVPNLGDRSEETPAYGPVPDGVSTCSTPPSEGHDDTGTGLSPEAEYEDPF